MNLFKSERTTILVDPIGERIFVTKKTNNSNFKLNQWVPIRDHWNISGAECLRKYRYEWRGFIECTFKQYTECLSK